MKLTVQSVNMMGLATSGILLHAMFYLTLPITIVGAAYALGSCGPGVALSALFITPIAGKVFDRGRESRFFSGYTLKNVTIAIYVGLALRFCIKALA
ncbi:MAG: hypothetical protein PVH87_02725 [Desulfobacteraceae bacterium]|jgi:hypothetical protein